MFESVAHWILRDRAIPCAGDSCFVQDFDRNKADSPLNFSDHTEPCQGSSCSPQTLAASKAGLLSVAIGEVAMTLTFHAWDYSAIAHISSLSHTIFGRQGNEFHVLTFQ